MNKIDKNELSKTLKLVVIGILFMLLFIVIVFIGAMLLSSFKVLSFLVVILAYILLGMVSTAISLLTAVALVFVAYDIGESLYNRFKKNKQ